MTFSDTSLKTRRRSVKVETSCHGSVLTNPIAGEVVQWIRARAVAMHQSRV